MKASMPPRQAAVSTSALWHGPSCQLFVKKGSVAPGALQQDLKSRGSAVFVQPTAQTAIGPRRTSRAARLEHQQCRSIPLAIMDTAPEWTLDQIAGLAFGGILVASVLLAYKVDEAIARSQRRDLGICEECGGLFDSRTCEEKRCPLREGGTKKVT